MKDYKVKQKREANIVSKNNKKNEANKVNGGVFVYTKALTVGELAKELNILPLCNSLNIINKTKLNGIVE